jgi:hypothetical protein
MDNVKNCDSHIENLLYGVNSDLGASSEGRRILKLRVAGGQRSN